MAVWSLEPTMKKSLVERTYWRNDKGEQLVHDIGWRWGKFTVYTEDNVKPEIKDGDNLWDCGYDVEMEEMTDGCWEEYDYDDVSPETQEWLEEFLDENSTFDLEEHGWHHADTECWITCEPEIELLESTPTGEDPVDDGKPKWPNT